MMPICKFCQNPAAEDHICHAIQVISQAPNASIAALMRHEPTQAVASYTGRGTATGTNSTHFFAGRDAEILDRVISAAAMLHVIAQEMRGFAAADGETRALIKACVSLSSDLENEVDRRKGKQL